MTFSLNIVFICVEYLLSIQSRSLLVVRLFPFGSLWLLSILKGLESFSLTFKGFFPNFLHMLGGVENFVLFSECLSINSVSFLLSSLGFMINIIGNLNSSGLTHTSNINDLLKGLDGILEDWLNRLHNTKSSLHIIDLWLHALNSLHFSGNFNEWLSIVESLKDSGSKGLLNILNSGGL